MPAIGLKSAMYNQIDPSTKKYKTLTGSAVPKLERIIDEKFSKQVSEADLYADDVIAESNSIVAKGTLTVTVADEDDARDAEFLGSTVSSGTGSSGEVTRKTTDSAPEMGYGHIIPMVYKGTYKYKVEFFPRVKWSDITIDRKTKGENLEYATPQLTGTVMPLAETINGMEAGIWEKHKTFTTESAAVTYLTGLLTPST